MRPGGPYRWTTRPTTDATGTGPHSGPASEEALRALSWGGRFVTVGFASGEIPRIPLNLVLLKGVWVTGFTMEGFGRNQAADRERDLAELAELARTGVIAMARGMQIGRENHGADASKIRKRSLDAPSAAALPPS